MLILLLTRRVINVARRRRYQRVINAHVVHLCLVQGLRNAYCVWRAAASAPVSTTVFRARVVPWHCAQGCLGSWVLELGSYQLECPMDLKTGEKQSPDLRFTPTFHQLSEAAQELSFPAQGRKMVFPTRFFLMAAPPSATTRVLKGPRSM